MKQRSNIFANSNKYEFGAIARTRQNDSFSCGVFVRLYARCIVFKRELSFPNSSAFLSLARKYLWTVIQNDADTHEQALCRKCQQIDGPEKSSQRRTTDWVCTRIFSGPKAVHNSYMKTLRRTNIYIYIKYSGYFRSSVLPACTGFMKAVRIVVSHRKMPSSATTAHLCLITSYMLTFTFANLE